MVFVPVRRVASGASCLATVRTSVTANVGPLPPAGIVTVTAPSKAYGTSTPCVLRPSARVYSTWYRLMVTSLLLVGANEKSLDAVLNSTVPLSLAKQGVCGVHGSGLVTPRTFERSGAGVSESMTRYIGELPCRTTSPHETLADTMAASPINRMRVRMSLALDDLRGDKDKQLGVRLVDAIASEQPFQERHV